MKTLFRIVGGVVTFFGVIMLIASFVPVPELGIMSVIVSLVFSAIIIAIGVMFIKKSSSVQIRKPVLKRANKNKHDRTASNYSYVKDVSKTNDIPEIYEEPAQNTQKPQENVVQKSETVNDEQKEEYSYYGFKVAGISFKEKDIIDNLMYENDDYSMSKRDIIDYGMIDERIYKYVTPSLSVEFVPEPDNPHDPNAIMVIVNGLHIGYVPETKTRKLNRILSEKDVNKIACEIYGGPYKIVSEDYNDYGKEVYSISNHKTNIGAEIAIKYK